MYHNATTHYKVKKKTYFIYCEPSCPLQTYYFSQSCGNPENALQTSIITLITLKELATPDQELLGIVEDDDLKL